MLGPIDYIAVGFEGNNFDGSILKELRKAVDSGAIRVVDLLFVIKDKDGAIAMAEVTDQSADLKNLTKTLHLSDELPLITEDDIHKLSASMDNDTSAGILVIEHLWAKGLKKAIVDADGILVAEGRIHPEVIEAAIEEIAANETIKA